MTHRGPFQPLPFCDSVILFSLGKRRLQGNLIAAFQYLKRAYKKAGERLFSSACSDRTSGNRFKLKEILYDEGGEALEQVAQRSCGCPPPWTCLRQGQIGL